MNGMEIMLKSFGLDPEKIKSELVDAKDKIAGAIENLDSRLKTIDDRLTRIEIKLNTIPRDEAMKLLAENTPTADELEQFYGRDNNDNGN